MNWIEKEIIGKQLQQINKDFFQLGEELALLKKSGNLNYEEIYSKYGLTKNKINEYIENAEFIKKNKIDNYKILGIKKINLLKKVKDKNKLKELLKKENLTEEEIKKYIPNSQERRIYKKCFNFNKNEIQMFEEAKKTIEKDVGNKITNSQAMAYILTYFLSNYCL